MNNGQVRVPRRARFQAFRLVARPVLLVGVLIVPVLVANQDFRGWVSAPIGAASFVCLWLFVMRLAFGSVLSLYGRRRPRWEIVFSPGGVELPEEIPPPPPELSPVEQMEHTAAAASMGGIALARIEGAVTAFLSYVLYIHAFATAYLFLATRNPEAFSERGLSYVDCVYLSATTATTVGFGDISPLSPQARGIAVAQMALNVVYVVGLFSAIAAAVSVRDQREHRT